MMQNTIKKLFASQLYTISLYSRQIAGTVVLLFITRFLLVSEYGLFRSYGTIATFCLMFANLDYSNYILVSSKAKVQEVKLKISLFILFAIFILLFVLSVSLFIPLEDHIIFGLVLIRTFFDVTFFTLILPYFQSTKKFNTISIINIFYSIMTVVFAFLCYLMHYNLKNFLYLSIALGLFNFIQCTYYAKINYFLLFKHIKKVLNKIDKSIFAYMGASITWFLYAQIPSLYVSTLIKKDDAAIFFAAFTIANIVYVLVNAQNQKLLPELIKSSYCDSVKIIKNNILIIFSALAVILFVFILFGQNILQLIYGNEIYGSANIILIILMTGNMFIALGAIYGAYITAKGYQKHKPKMMLEASIITIISLLMFHKFGIYDAAISFLLAGIYAGCRFTLFARKLLQQQNNKENYNE